ncbi:MAG: hypothetical protein E7623_00930 [Ruminococcaceae bacterium]|nr:hypothetical protein [Oscillospiraceae bacterium]
MLKRYLALISAALLCTFCLCSCGEPDDDQIIIEQFKALYERAAVLNEAVYGMGFPYEGKDKAEDYTVAHYCRVKEDCPYGNTEEMKAAVKETYSSGYAEAINSLMFEGMDYDSEQIQGFQPRYKDIDGQLAVDITYEGFEITTVLDTDTVTVKEKKAKKCTVEVKYTGSSGEGTLEVKLVKENDKWLLDSATY